MGVTAPLSVYTLITLPKSKKKDSRATLLNFYYIDCLQT